MTIHHGRLVDDRPRLHRAARILRTAYVYAIAPAAILGIIVVDLIFAGRAGA